MSNSILPVAILAGGLATRLRPLTETIPKALLEINGEPFIAHQLRLLKKNHVTQIVICTGYLGEMIQAYVGDGARFGVQVQYSFDGEKLLGTGGAIKQALPLLGEAFFVLYGDSYLPCDYRAVQTAFQQSDKKALMTVFRNAGRWDSSNVEFNAGEILVYDKKNRTPNMHYIDYGLGMFQRTAFAEVSNTIPSDLAQLYQNLLQQQQLAAYEVHERFYEAGSFTGIKEMSEYLFYEENNMTFTKQFLSEANEIIAQLNTDHIDKMVHLLADTRDNHGRLFVLGVGGSAANASHAVNDFRKIAGIEAYAPTDNVSELTARTNDDGWASVFANWLQVSRLNAKDMLLILSVGGGNLEKNVSPNLVAALQHAKKIGARVAGIVGRDGGYTAQVADACVIIPTVNPENTTPHAEAFQAVVWHCLVSHPQLKASQTKWESVK